jgi:hypothetical protein
LGSMTAGLPFKYRFERGDDALALEIDDDKKRTRLRRAPLSAIEDFWP